MFFEIVNVNKKRQESFFKLVEGFSKKHAIKNIVEIGPGNGELAERVVTELAVDMVMVDLEDKRVFQRGLEFFKADCSSERIPLEDGAADMVIASQVLEHVENPTFFINEIDRVLCEGGFCLMSWPNFSNVFQRYDFLKTGNVRRLNGKLNEGGHVNFITSKQLIHMVSDAWSPVYVNGDALAFCGRIPGLLNRLSDRFDNRHIVFPKFKSLMLSYNVDILFRKK